MGVTRTVLLALAVSTLAALGPSRVAYADDSEAQMRAHAAQDEAERAARWQQLQQAVFGKRALADGAGVIQIEAPEHALDARFVPITLTMKSATPIKGLYVVIDNNPSPVAGHFTLVPVPTRAPELRVRVNQYTFIHAVAETVDGKLFVSRQFVKTSGGCSAPVGADNADALKDIGLMKLHLLGPFSPGKSLQAQLMIRIRISTACRWIKSHASSRRPRFIRTIDATYDGAPIFHLDSDISLSTDPVITFGFRAR